MSGRDTGRAPWEREPEYAPTADYGAYEYDPFDAPPRITFSGREILHLAGSVLTLTIAFSFALLGMGVLTGAPVDLEKIIEIAPWSFLIVFTAFVLHELAHKVAAQMKHMWAEFQASPAGLGFGLVMSVLTGFVLAAPGAVVIYGDATRRESGVISIVGPLTNIAIALIAIPFYFGRILDFTIGGLFFWQVLMFVNAFLAAFNMLPVPPLDGSKVWKWSKLAYFGTVLVILGLLVLATLGPAAFAPPCIGTQCR